VTTRWLVVAGLLGLVGCGGDSAPDGPADDASPTGTGTGVEPNAVVDWIVDGDTIDVIVDGREERVRLTGIDTPEVAHAASGTRPAQVAECFGDEATAFVTQLVPVGTEVRLERDVVGRDDYGRLLAYVYRADGVFVNYEIVRQGYAQPLTIPPNVTHSDLFVEAARRAEADDVGLWAACG
jgi:micrococcal nuclease